MCFSFDTKYIDVLFGHQDVKNILLSDFFVEHWVPEESFRGLHFFDLGRVNIFKPFVLFLKINVFK